MQASSHGAAMRRRYLRCAADDRHRRRGILGTRWPSSCCAASAPGPAAHRHHRTARRARRRRGLCHARLSLSAQRGRRTDVAGRRRAPATSSTSCAARASTPTAGDYLPRQVYGEYLRARLAEASRSDPRADALAGIAARARCNCGAASAGWELWLDDGSTRVPTMWCWPLAMRRPPGWPELAPHRRDRCVSSTTPGASDDCAHQNIGSVLLLGSGLTMIDAALRLAAIRPRVRRIHVLSRHGCCRNPRPATPAPARKPGAGCAARRSRARLTRLLRELARAGRSRRRRLARGARAGARAPAGASGARLSRIATCALPASCARLLGRASPSRAGGAARRRCARSNARACSTCTPAASRKCARLDDDVEVIWRPRGAQRSRAWLVDRVVNCTGPDARVTRNAGSAGAVAARQRPGSGRTRSRSASTSAPTDA